MNAVEDEVRTRWGTAATLHGFESLMWRLDQHAGIRSAVVGIELLDAEPEMERLRRAHLWAVDAVPRLRQRLVEPLFGLGAPTWVDDIDFSLDRHLFDRCLPAPGGERELLDLARDFAMEPFAGDRPPWAAMRVMGLASGGTAFIFKIHHAMTDGIGTVQLLSAMHSRQRASSGRQAPTGASPAAATPSALGLTLKQCREGMVAFPETAREGSRRVAALVDRMRGRDWVSEGAHYAASLRRVLVPMLPPPSPLLRGRSGRWHFEAMTLPLADMKRTAKLHGVSLNDVLVSGILGGLRRYHEAFEQLPRELPISFPISIRAELDSEGGNHFAPGYFSGPLAERDPVRRMRLIGEQVRRVRGEPALAAPLAAMPVLSRMPPGWVSGLMQNKIASADIQISNVPGIREHLYLSGAKVVRILPFPPLPGSAAMIAMLTHGEECCLGFNLDSDAITNPALLMRTMHESYAEVFAAGSTTQ